MPLPFSRGIFICGEPMYVRHNATDAEMEQARARLEDVLNELTRRADAAFDG